MLSFLQARFPSLALQVDSWFQLTEKSDIHLTLIRTDTVDPDHLLTPNQDLLKVVRLEGDTSQLRDTSFNSSSRRFYDNHRDKCLIYKVAECSVN
ncbi:unnamed protein product [Ambrosiozyma monospora]|uniref:Unnamed protein product n=1 Tax=Ambrosiozyma monospora TaxID=43982 RepID=A0A9W6T8E4_AMBMO|nr:unnamed protein product [Ambrosiozyma monospora]